jgi:hypothetical protein
VLYEAMSQPMFDGQPLDLLVRGEWLLRVSKTCMLREFADVRNSLLNVKSIFQSSEDEEQGKEDE